MLFQELKVERVSDKLLIYVSASQRMALFTLDTFYHWRLGELDLLSEAKKYLGYIYLYVSFYLDISSRAKLRLNLVDRVAGASSLEQRAPFHCKTREQRR
jgi:hypothetical protein